MSRSARHLIAAACVLFLFGAAKEAHAIPLENDVDLDWVNTRFAPTDDFATVLGMPRLILEGEDPGDLVFDIDVIAPDQLDGFRLDVLVVDEFGNQYLSGGTPLVLTSPAGSSGYLFNWADFYDRDPVEDPTHAQLTLSSFDNFNLLPTEGDWIYLLHGTFFGATSVGEDPDPNEPLPTYQGPLRITVTASGVGTAVPTTQPVPEPATLTMLLLGMAAGSLGIRRRRR